MRSRRLVALVVLLLAISAGGPRADAYPLEARYGGLNFSSPVEAHPGSIIHNPAAISLLKGFHLFLDATVRLDLQRIKRDGIDTSTGLPPASGASADLAFDRHTALHVTPDTYFAVTWDMNTELFVAGISVLTPFAELHRFHSGTGRDPAQENDLRYHRIRADWVQLDLTGAVAVRIHSRIRFGLAFSYVRSMLNFQFGRDRKLRVGSSSATAPLFEDPAFSETVQVKGAADAFAFKLGVLVRLPKDVDVGLAYRSKPVSANQTTIRTEGEASVLFRDGGQLKKATGRGRTVFELPDSFTLAVKWKPVHWIALTFGFDYFHWGVHKDIRFTLTGNEFRAEQMANFDLNFTHYRGFQDVFRLWVQAAYYRSRNLTLGGAVMYESPAVKSEWVNPAVIDTHKLDLRFSVVWRVHRNVALHFGYAVSLAPEVKVPATGFDPGFIVRCLEERVDILWSSNCRETKRGRGLNVAAGTYWQMTHRLGVGISYDYD